MGPSLVFDKSAIEALSIDESVWMDNYYICNVTPIFYVETLADLSKSPTNDRSAMKIVSDIASKTPIKEAVPNVAHPQLILNNLLGNHIEMSGRPFIFGGQYKVSPDGKIGVFHENFPEMEAFNRWNDGKFAEVERDFASGWRKTVISLNFDSTIALIKNTIPTNQKISNLEDIRIFVEDFVKGNYKELYILAFELLGIPVKYYGRILDRWSSEGHPSFENFAPYAAFCLKVDLLFYIALYKSFESKDRTSNKIDISYLYYLPFCDVFVSRDNIHKRFAPLMMRKDQTFIWGDDFKEDMKKIDEYFSKLPEEIKEKSLFKFATYPPDSIDSLTASLWDKYAKLWRKHKIESDIKPEMSKEENDKLIASLNKIEQESINIKLEPTSTYNEPDSVMIKRQVPVRRGKWRLIPKDVENATKIN